jgi:hypothetical protein
MRRILLRSHAVVLGNLRVDTEDDGPVLRGEVREPLRPAEPLDPHARGLGDVSHVELAYLVDGGVRTPPDRPRGVEQPSLGASSSAVHYRANSAA